MASETVRIVEAHEWVYAGVDHPQYFQGCGVAHTEFDVCFLGVGDSPREAAEDALEQAACAGWSVEGIDVSEFAEDSSELDAIRVDEEDEPIPCELAYHVSIRLKGQTST